MDKNREEMRNMKKKGTYRRLCGVMLAGSLVLGAPGMNVQVNAGVIPGPITIDSPKALSQVGLPQNGQGSIRWANGSATPSQYANTYQVIFTPAAGTDFSKEAGWDAATGTVRGNVTVYVKSLAPKPTPTQKVQPTPTQTPQATEAPKVEPTPSEVQKTEPTPSETPKTETTPEAGQGAADTPVTDQDTDKKDTDSSKEDDLDKEDTEDSKEDADKEDAEDSKEDANKEDTEGSKEDADKEDAEDSKEDADKEDAEDSKEDADKEDTEDSKEDIDKEDVEDSKEDIDKEDTEDSKEDADKEDAEDSKEDADKNNAEDPQEEDLDHTIGDSSDENDTQDENTEKPSDEEILEQEAVPEEAVNDVVLAVLAADAPEEVPEVPVTVSDNRIAGSRPIVGGEIADDSYENDSSAAKPEAPQATEKPQTTAAPVPQETEDYASAQDSYDDQNTVSYEQKSTTDNAAKTRFGVATGDATQVLPYMLAGLGAGAALIIGAFTKIRRKTVKTEDSEE